ncbi:carbohydrate kinase [Treponema ruminis]|uniref:Fructokinase n=1 Tax=Treponema ruminis TaxID=744515 RepID=A0A7W8LMF3_9SPIR|nr:carbohydrate kinase [Treponema ruminis]MBB5226412.1 fructokinase [Treponema ruminis]QSI02683.1 carbohydrate kinase [Treponema ruminis]
MKKYDVVALGEILIDFTFAGTNADGKKLYEENPGGAPANCVSAVSKLGGKGAFIGMTGRDSFGEDVRRVLEEINVDTSGMRYSESQHTTLAFVSLDPNGERHFSFCRNPGADTQIRPEDLDRSMLENARFLHIGSLSLTDEPAKSATLAAIEITKKAGGLISYDPNWRANLWKGRSDAIDLMKSLFPLADTVKVSDEELALLFGKDISAEEGGKKILSLGPSLAMITLGAKGVYYAARTLDGSVISGTVGCKDVKVVDTTGAGDSFTGGMLYRLTRRENPLAFTKENLEADLNFANTVASICVTRRGAIPALPTLKEVENF